MSNRFTAKVPFWRRVTLRDVIYLTLPPMLLALWLAGSAVLDYHRIRQFDDWWSNATSVRKFAWYSVRSLLRAPEMTAIEHRLSPELEDKPILRLKVAKNDWNRIDADAAGTWGEWIDATIVDGNDLHDAELRLRGDGSAHWTTEKKSFTLKTKKKELYNGFTSMAFSVKDVFPQWLVGTLEKDFDLLAPEQDLVPVYLNERFYGLHRFVEPIDESFLRRHVRLPGNVFRADTAERGDYFKGLPREVFVNPFIWDRVANNDRPGAIGTKALGELIADLNTSTPQERERLMAHFDVDELSRLLAFLLLVGDPYHMSGIHNQFWYEDPSNEKLHPVVWDVRLLDLESPPRGSNINRLWRAVLKDPRVWDGAMREVAKWLEGDKLLKIAEERVNKAAARFKDELAYDNLRAGVIPPVGTPEETLAVLRKNLATLRGWIGDARAAANVGEQSSKSMFVVDVVASGRAGVELVGFQLPAAIHEQDDWGLWPDESQDGRLEPDADRLLPLRFESARLLLEQPELLMPGVTGTGPALDVERRSYRYFLSGRHYADFGGKAVMPILRNAMTHEPITADAVTTTALPSSSVARWRPLPAESKILTGSVHLTGTLAIGEHGTLTVEPGTNLVLDPDVSIVVRGLASFHGTEQNPITIQRSNPDLPWGVIAIQGPGANGSKFEHVKFLGGGGALLNDVEYTGSICVHDAFHVTFDHCEVANNSRCDDGLHVDRGDVTVTNCWFHDCNSDSLDLDMSTALVMHNKIERSGNDGFDLMTCTPRILDNEIVGSGDKGISVGENSAPFVFDNVIRDCERGIEVKDRSAPLVLHTTITGCRIGVLAHIKNWRYGEAGWPTLARSFVTDNAINYTAQDGARCTIASSMVGEAGDGCSAPEADVEWLLRQSGVSVDVDVPGSVPNWKAIDPVAPLYAGRFEEDFVERTDHWLKSGSVTQLHKRAHDLVANFGDERGTIGLAVDWDLSDASRKYVLVLEIAGENVRDVQVVAESNAGNASAPVEIASEPTEYRLATLELPPGLYTALLLSAAPKQTRARLALHGWRVVGWPIAAGGK